MAPRITFFHTPNTRSTGVRILLTELGAPHEMRVLDMKAGENRGAAYRAINPMGKVPAILDGDDLVTEQGAIFIHLADRFREARLAPGLDEPGRGSYLRWIAFHGACFEPAVIDKAQGHAGGSPAMLPYGDFDTMLGAITGALRPGPYLLGDRFSAADILWATALRWTTGFGLVPAAPAITDYVERVTARPAFKTVQAAEDALSAELDKARAAT